MIESRASLQNSLRAKSPKTNQQHGVGGHKHMKKTKLRQQKKNILSGSSFFRGSESARTWRSIEIIAQAIQGGRSQSLSTHIEKSTSKVFVTESLQIQSLSSKCCASHHYTLFLSRPLGRLCFGGNCPAYSHLSVVRSGEGRQAGCD